uniref:F-box protein At2g02240-like n=1 Tax=Erigeron canadensis TaxID=72917 RepID=UPI001CB8D306|nr:F-box protein At2g02240-like [Erigeron canadensis]
MNEELNSGLIGIKDDIYSLGVVLCEIMSGMYSQDTKKSLGNLALRADRRRNFDSMVFEGIKKQIVPQSLITFQRIAIRCLEDSWTKRPPAGAVVIELKKALEIQEDYEIWGPKLPKGYEEIFQMSEKPDMYFTEKKKNLYDILTEGILLQNGTVLFSLGSNGERNKMISATKFSYKNRWSHKWRSISGSRFQKVAKMLDISNMKIQIRTRTQFLSPGVNYSVHLVFKFCRPRKSQAKRMYVNLKYKRGKENLNAYFATWREDEWMMIELFRFLNDSESTDFEVQLESFSRCYCGSRAVYIQGIEFQEVNDASLLTLLFAQWILL